MPLVYKVVLSARKIIIALSIVINATSICSNQDRALCLINTTKVRGQYSQYKGIWLEMRHSSTYREIALAFAEQPSEAAKYDQIAILLEILVLLPLANAVSEGGFSLQTA